MLEVLDTGSGFMLFVMEPLNLVESYETTTESISNVKLQNGVKVNMEQKCSNPISFLTADGDALTKQFLPHYYLSFIALISKL